jgi:hypothetical protein
VQFHENCHFAAQHLRDDGDTTLILDVRDYLDYIRNEAERLRASGATSDDAAATITQNARARWDTWDNPEWIGFAARYFYDVGQA